MLCLWSAAVRSGGQQEAAGVGSASSERHGASTGENCWLSKGEWGSLQRLSAPSVYFPLFLLLTKTIVLFADVFDCVSSHDQMWDHYNIGLHLKSLFKSALIKSSPLYFSTSALYEQETAVLDQKKGNITFHWSLSKISDKVPAKKQSILLLLLTTIL